MPEARMAFTAVYFRGPQGYVGFVEEPPGVNSHGRTIEEARVNLQRLAAELAWRLSGLVYRAA